MNFILVTFNSPAAQTYMSGLSRTTLIFTHPKYLFWYRTNITDTDINAMYASGNLLASVSTAYLESLL